MAAAVPCLRHVGGPQGTTLRILGQLARSDKGAAADLCGHLHEAGKRVVEKLPVAFAVAGWTVPTFFG